MTKTLKLSLIAMLLFAMPVHAVVVEEKPPVETSSSGSGSEVAAGLIFLTLLGIIIASNFEPETSNCDTISDQTIYGADGKPIVTAETNICD